MRNLRIPGLLESHAMPKYKKNSNYGHLYVSLAKGSMSGTRNKFKLKLRTPRLTIYFCVC